MPDPVTAAAPFCFAIFCADGLEVEHHNHCTMAWYHAGRWTDGGCGCGGPHVVRRVPCDSHQEASRAV